MIRFTKKQYNLFENYKLKYHIGKVWTTDGIYRETRDKVKLRKLLS